MLLFNKHMDTTIEEEFKKLLLSSYHHGYSYVNTLLDDVEKKIIIKISKNDIKYLMKNYQFIKSINIYTYIFISCVFSNNINILDFLVEKYNIEVENYIFMALNKGYSNPTKRTLLMQACAFNPNVCIIKHLIEKYKSNYNYCDNNDYNCLRIACVHNNNIEIIKYLIEVCKMDPNEITIYHDNCLILCCWENTNFDIAKYLIDECNMDIMYENNNNNNCVEFTKSNVVNLVYLLKKIEVKNIKLKYYKNIINDILPFFVNDFDKYNQILLLYKNKNDDNLKKKIILLNTLMLNSQNIIKYGFENPFKVNFTIFTEMVNKLTCVIPIENIESYSKIINLENNFEPNYTKKPQILFKNNGIEYFGDIDSLKSILIFNDTNNFMNYRDVIDLDFNIQEYVLNLYVHFLHSGFINIKKILPEDLTQFLKFIDRYPAIKLSINEFEYQIIDYIQTNKIEYDDFLISLCKRYHLKYMYLDIHNQKFINVI